MKLVFLFVASLLAGCVLVDPGTYDSWILVQYDGTGTPIMCRRLIGTQFSMTNSGFRWVDRAGRTIVVTGQYAAIQIDHGDQAGSAGSLGVDPKLCW